jgi:ribosome-binding protein aMBF1 (putative translation factor)
MKTSPVYCRVCGIKVNIDLSKVGITFCVCDSCTEKIHEEQKQSLLETN